MRQLLFAIALAVLASACSDAQPGVAESGSAGDPETLALIEARQDNFERISDANKALKAELENSQPDLAVLQAQVENIGAAAGQVADAFPAGSGAESGVETAALPAIWSDPQGFTVAAARFTDQTQVLVQATQSGDLAAIRTATLDLGTTCRNCHDTFRQKKD